MELLVLLSCRKGPVLFLYEGGLSLLPGAGYSGESGAGLETSGASGQVCPPEGPKFLLLVEISLQ